MMHPLIVTAATATSMFTFMWAVAPSHPPVYCTPNGLAHIVETGTTNLIPIPERDNECTMITNTALGK